MHKPLIAIAAALAALATAPTALAQSPPHVYWTNEVTNTIGEANLDGTSPNQGFITGATVHPGWRPTASTSIGPTTARTPLGRRTSMAPM